MIRYLKISLTFLACFGSVALNNPALSLDLTGMVPTLSYEEYTVDDTYVKLQDVLAKNKADIRTKPCGKRDSVEIRITEVQSDGTLSTDQGTFKIGQYYVEVDNVSSGGVSFRGCVCKIKACISKCCPLNYVYNTSSVDKCQHVDTVDDTDQNKRTMASLSLQFFDLTKPHAGAVDYVFVTTISCRDGKYLLEPASYPEDTNYLQPNGSIWKIDKEDYKMFNSSEYCVDKIVDNGTVVQTMMCFRSEFAEQEFSSVAYPVGMLISVPFLIATFLVYAIVPELRNLHGKSLMCHVMSLACGYTFLAIVQINTNITNHFCIIFGFVILFSFLVCFFWLNVMCFDIWWTFSGFRGFRGSKRAAEHKKFIVYSVYAWGSPIVIIIITLCLQFHPSVPDTWRKPSIGSPKCFLHDDALFAYFYGPMLVLILCNVALFVATAFKIFKIQKDTAVLKRDDSQRHDNYENDRQRFNLYFKLFVVMGINWTLELISYFTGGPKWVWYVTDIGNTLQGALIFIIFVCKRNVWKLLVKRYHSLTGRPHLAHVSMTRTTGYSTQQSTVGSQGKETINGMKFTSIESSQP